MGSVLCCGRTFATWRKKVITGQQRTKKYFFLFLVSSYPKDIRKFQVAHHHFHSPTTATFGTLISTVNALAAIAIAIAIAIAVVIATTFTIFAKAAGFGGTFRFHEYIYVVEKLFFLH